MGGVGWKGWGQGSGVKGGVKGGVRGQGPGALGSRGGRQLTAECD